MLVRSFGVTFSWNLSALPNSEAWDQLVYAIRGVLTVKTEAATWVVPPHRAVWIPAGVRYCLQVSGQTALRTVYLRRNARAGRSPTFDRARCAVVSVSPLLRELIVRTVNIGALQANLAPHRRMAGLIQDELQSAGTVPLQLPYPKSERALNFAGVIDGNLGESLDISCALTHCGSSRRTMERLFQAETGMSLGQWVRRRKLLSGLESLLKGETTGAVAFKLGYNGPSAFIAMFKKELGATPGAYLSEGDKIPSRQLQD